MTIKALYPNIDPSLSLDFANTKALDPRITFARASTARFYDGVTTAKAEENLFTKSQEFDDAAWIKNLATITANTTAAPDGTTTAETLTATATTGTHFTRQNLTVGAGAYAFSCFVKEGTHSFVQLTDNLNANIFANFDLTTGAVGTVGSAATASIASVGNGWYRCTMFMTLSSAANQFYIALIPSSTSARAPSWAAAGTETVFLWGAQLEQRSAVTAYTPTTDQPITNYVPVLQSAANNVARFDHNPVTGESLGLLIEEQRTNLLLRSEEFDNASWTKTRSSIAANTIVAPDGTLTGDKYIANTDSNTHVLDQSTTNSNAAYTFSVYMKAGEYSNAQVLMSDLATAAVGIQVNLAAGTFTTIAGGSWTSVSGSVTPIGNGWYRCSVTSTRGAGTQTNCRILPVSGGVISFAGDGYSGIYIWGAQLEAGAFPTSYIPTVASQVTRSADAASMTGANFSSWYRADEGTLYASANQSDIPTGAGFSYVTLRFNNDNAIGIGSTNANNIVRYNGVNELAFNLQPPTNALSKIALAYKVNDGAASLNGETPLTDSSFNLPLPNTLLIGQNRVTGITAKLYVQKIAFYPKRLANAELQALTQI
jgi:hypothetical protein